jgi:putative solute:sodium symporter small subunit
MANQRSSAFLDNLGRTYGMYTGVFIAFVILIFNYAAAMNRIDRRHNLHESEEE